MKNRNALNKEPPNTGMQWIGLRSVSAKPLMLSLGATERVVGWKSKRVKSIEQPDNFVYPPLSGG